MSRLKVLAYPRARKLHVADPTGRKQALCGKRGYPEMRGYLNEHPAEAICTSCLLEAQ